MAVAIFLEFVFTEVEVELSVEPYFWFSLVIEPDEVFTGFGVSKKGFDAVKSLQR